MDAYPVEQPTQPPQAPRAKRQVAPAFWTIASVLSLVVNLVLIILVIALASQVFTLKRLITEQLLGGLYNNFVLMDEARIQTTIAIDEEVPAKFNLKLNTDTTVVLTEDTPIQGARVSLSTGGMSIYSAPTDIILPEGTPLPIHLKLTVPVDKMIPVQMDVKVDIPLKETDLHEPFVGLQEVVGPYYHMLNEAPNSWGELICGKRAGSLCRRLIP